MNVGRVGGLGNLARRFFTMSSTNFLLSGIQIVQQIITPTGEIHQIPIQLNAQQLQVVHASPLYILISLSPKVIRAQMMGGAGSSQPIVIQTAPIQAQIAQPAQVKEFLPIVKVTWKTVWFWKL